MAHTDYLPVDIDADDNSPFASITNALVLIVIKVADAVPIASCSSKEYNVFLGDGVTEIPYDEVVYDDSDGTYVYIEFYTTLTLLSYAATPIRVHFGEESGVDQSDPTAVYPSDHEGMWHLDEDPTGTAPQMKDSTSNAAHGTTNGSMTAGDSIACKVGNGLTLDGTDDYVDVTSANLRITGDMTFGGWFYKNAAQADKDGWIACAAVGEAEADNYLWSMLAYLASGSDIQYLHEHGSGTDAQEKTLSANLSLSTWYHLVYVRDTSAKNVKCYRDGALIETDTYSTNPTGGGNANTFIGLNPADISQFAPIRVDELMVLSAKRSADWIKWIYKNQSEADNEQTHGSVTALPSAGVAPTGNISGPLVGPLGGPV